MRASRRAAGLAALLGPALLAACTDVVDVDQARICRLVLPAIHAEGATFQIQRTAPGTEPGEVRIVYRVSEEGRPSRTRFILCRFAGAGLSPGRRNLVSVVTEAGPMAEAPLYFLRRFYLGSGEGNLKDPGAGDAAAVPQGPMWLAYALQQIVAGIPQTAVYGLLAAAYSLVYGLVGRIVFGFGELAAVGGYAALLAVAAAWGGNPAGLLWAILLAAPLAVAAGTLHGTVVGRLVVAPLVRKGGLPVLIATTGSMIALGEYMRLVQGPDLRWIPPFLSSPLPLLRSGSFVATLTPMAVLAAATCLCAAAAVLFLLGRTAFGRAWRAYADDPGMAALMGVDAARLFALTFALSSALAGLAGFVLTVHFGGVGYGGGLVLGLKALVAAVLGGIGSVPGAFLGGLALGLAEALWSATMPIESRDIAVFVLLSVVLALRPGGILGFGELSPRRV